MEESHLDEREQTEDMNLLTHIILLQVRAMGTVDLN